MVLLLLKISGHQEEVGDELASASVQHASLRVRRPYEGSEHQLLQFMLDGIEAFLPRRGIPPQAGGVLRVRSGLAVARIAKQRVAGHSVGSRAVARQERLGLAAGQSVTLRRVGQANLLLTPEHAQAQPGAQAQTPRVDARPQFRVQATPERQAALNPALLAPQKFSDRGWR
jgi:hypothetical protein